MRRQFVSSVEGAYIWSKGLLSSPVIGFHCSVCPSCICVSYCPCCCGNIPQQCDWREKGSVLARTSRSAYQGSEVRMEEH